METKAYLGDGLYGSFDGYQVKLYVEGGSAEPNAVFLNARTLQTFLDWVKNGYPDHNTGRKFGE